MSYDPANWYWQLADGSVYSSADQSAIEVDDESFTRWRSAGNEATKIANMNELIEVLHAANVPPFHLVPARLIVDRLLAAGKLDAANAALNAADLYTQQRWKTRDAIYADDPTANALLISIGAEPEEILAP